MVYRTGTNRADRLNGTGGADVFDGLFGNDRLVGLGGNDTLDGGAENDVLIGGSGSDDYIGGAGADTLDGNTSGYGEDTAVYALDAGRRGVRVDFAERTATDTFGNRDVLIDIERVVGSRFADVLIGGNVDNDGYEMFAGLRGNDIIDGGSGFDEAFYTFDARSADGRAGIVANLATGTIRDGFGTVDTVRNIESVRGTDYADRMTGSTGDEFFRALGGADTLDGGGGIDAVQYRFDETFGGPRDGVVVDLVRGRATDAFGATDTLRNIENVEATYYDDRLTGNGRANELVGLGGADRIFGGAGSDALYGDFRNEDPLAGADTLSGGLGNDFLYGGSGRDDLTGGAGADRFVLSTGGDIIRDFQRGVDKLAGFRADVPNNWVLVANADPEAAVGRATILYDTDAGRIFYDADGRGGDPALLLATLTDRPTLGVSDFVFI